MRNKSKTVEEKQQQGAKHKPKVWQWVFLCFLVSFLIAAAVFAKTALGINWIDAYHSFPNLIEDMGVWGKLGIILLMIVHCFVPFPAEFVAIAAGSTFGFVEGTLLTWIGAMLGAILSFGLSRFFGYPFVEWALSEKQLSMLNRWTQDQGAVTLLVSRFIPVIAFNLINYAAGLTKISWWTFIWTTAVGIFPLTALMVYMGHGMRELSWSTLLAISLLCILIMAFAHYLKRRQDNQSS